MNWLIIRWIVPSLFLKPTVILYNCIQRVCIAFRRTENEFSGARKKLFHSFTESNVDVYFATRMKTVTSRIVFFLDINTVTVVSTINIMFSMSSLKNIRRINFLLMKVSMRLPLFGLTLFNNGNKLFDLDWCGFEPVRQQGRAAHQKIQMQNIVHDYYSIFDSHNSSR